MAGTFVPLSFIREQKLALFVRRPLQKMPYHMPTHSL